MNKKNGEKTPVIVYINFKNFWFFFSFWIKQEMELFKMEYEEFLSLDPLCSSRTIFVWPSEGQGDFWAWEPLEKTLKVNTTLFVRWHGFPSLRILFIVLLLFLFIARGILVSNFNLFARTDFVRFIFILILKH